LYVFMSVCFVHFAVSLDTFNNVFFIVRKTRSPPT
jgi:hypothetical protein